MSGWPVDQMTGEHRSTREPSMTSTHRGKFELWIGIIILLYKDDELYALVKCPLFSVYVILGRIQRFMLYYSNGVRHFSCTTFFLFSFREVLAELSKIERFTAIMAHQLTPNRQGIGGCGQLNEGCGQPEFPPFVKDALRQTKNIVQDIDTILGK